MPSLGPASTRLFLLCRIDAMAFAEQMVVDVASLTADVRAAGLAELGADAPAFVLAVWTEDMMMRAGTAWREMFGEEWRLIPTSAETDPWVAHERFLLEVAKLPALDPVTSELVRLRGARAHDCRLCQSRRSVSAIDLAGRSDLFDDRDPSGISHAQALALQVVDTFVWQPTQWPPGLGEQVVDALGPAAATELILDIVRNAANKIAVAFNVDDPQVETGVEYYDIDMSTGELRYDVSPLTSAPEPLARDGWDPPGTEPAPRRLEPQACREPAYRALRCGDPCRVSLI